MKKHITVFLILIISALFLFFNLKAPKLYKIIQVKGADILCVDFNFNSVCDKNENIKLFGINSFPEKFSSKSKYLEEKYSIPEKNFVVLGAMSKKYVSETILNKFVSIEVLNPEETPIIAKIYYKEEDFSQNLLKNGWALAFEDSYKIYENFSKVKSNITFSKKYNYKLRNKKSGKIHTLDCEYGRKSADYEIGIFDDEKYKKDYCHYCHKIAQTNPVNVKVIKSVNADYITEDLKIYFTDFLNNLTPDSSCKHQACKILLQNINEAKESIDFAIYGLGNMPEILEALINAQKRGVKIRFVVDEDTSHNNIYSKTDLLKSFLHNYKTDYTQGESSRFINSIMHNKFYIFDNEKVWLGSANVSETDLSGFNANNIIFVNSKELAKIYKSEFEKMYSGDFHTKKKTDGVKTIKVNDFDVVAAFSPQDKIITNILIPKIQNAKKSIYIETFVLTHKNLAKSLVDMKNKGVDVKIIVDATNASADYSMVKYLRQNKIPVKIENYAGKMHMKSLIIDDEYFISGSMNLSKSGENYNDENIIIIKSSEINKRAKLFFDYLWSNIPEKYLKQYVKAESIYSIGSCSDGIDNDYDGKVDKKDEDCKK